LGRFFDVIIPEVHRYEGTISQYMGDGFMALYGAPVAHEDHARRALLSALAIRRAVDSGVILPDGRNVPVALRIGVNTGFVIIGKVGNDRSMDFTAVGDTTNVAARLQQGASPGDILISAATHRFAPNVVDLESVGDLQLKGKRDVVTAYKVIRPRRPKLQPTTEPVASQLVGRDKELAGLHAALDDVETGQGQIVGLVGDPGMGKTRLLREFARTLIPHRATYLEGRCLPYGTGAPYFLIADLLRNNIGLEESDSPEATAEKLSRALSEVGLNVGQDSPYLLRLMGLDGGAQLPNATPEGFKHRVFGVLSQLAMRGSLRRTLILALEDLHWVDRASSEFLVTFSERMAGARILLIGTYRPGYSPPWSTKSYATQISLRPLTAIESNTVVEQFRPEIADHEVLVVINKSEGNPFFIEELVRHIADRERAGTSVPHTIHDVITARIDRLTPAAKRVLLAASVLGREFTADLLARVVGGAATLQKLLKELVRSEFLYERADLSKTTYVFRHGLTQEVAYGMLLSDSRARYHASAGAAIADSNAGRLSAVAELLAHHFGLGDRDEEAVRFALLAAENAQQRWANEQALAYFSAALQRLAMMPQTEQNKLLRVDAVLGQAESMFALGRQAEHVDALHSIKPLIEQSSDDRRKASWLYWMGFLHSFTGGKPEIAITYCREAAAIASRSGFKDVEAHANCCLAHVSVLAGDLSKALRAGEAALPVFEAQSNAYWACRTLWGMSMAANALGSWSDSLAFCHRALDHGRSVNDNRLIIVGWMRTGSTLILQGRPVEGIACCERALALTPTPFDARMIRSIRAYGWIRSNEIERGTIELEEETRWFEGSNLKYTWSYFTLWLSEAYLLSGRKEHALSLAKAALATAEALSYRHLQGFAYRLKAEILAQSHEALTSVDRAIEILRDVGARNDLAKAYLVKAGLEPGPRGRELLFEALGHFEALGTLDEITRARRLLEPPEGLLKESGEKRAP
jgi:tetratricopeptide (TPR) repeat protein